MEYAIRTLEIELAKIEETQRALDRYSVHPEYHSIFPNQPDWKAQIAELRKAIDVISDKQRKNNE